MDELEARGREWSRAQDLLQQVVALLGEALRELRKDLPSRPAEDHLTADLARVAAVLAGEAVSAGESSQAMPVRWQRLLDALIDFDAYLLLAEVGEAAGEVLEAGGPGLPFSPGQVISLTGLGLEDAWREGRPVAVYATPRVVPADPRLEDLSLIHI